MAKAPAIKFPRITAGFYSITFDGELVGYVAKQGESKDASWYVYNTNEPDLTPDTLLVSTIVDESDLFRVSKDFAKGFFTSAPSQEQEPEVEAVELQTPEWTETADEFADDTQDFFDEVNEFEELVEDEKLVAV
jgi:hypothetical protein